MEKIMLVYNQTSGDDQGRQLGDDFVKAAEKKDPSLTCTLQQIGPDIDDQEAVRAAEKQQIDTLIIIGGDGTINKMVTAFRDLLPKLTLGILPGGTVNNVAQALGIPLDFDGATEVILKGHTRPLDYGQIGKQSIVSTMTIGILADTAARITQKEKQKYGKIVFVRNFFKLLLKRKRYALEIEIDGEKRWQGKTQLLAILMTNSVGGYRNFDPLAKPDDGLFHLLILPRVNTLQLMLYLPKILLGKVNELPDLDYLTGARIGIRNKKSERVVTRVDGDPSADLPVGLQMVKHGITVLAPNQD